MKKIIVLILVTAFMILPGTAPAFAARGTSEKKVIEVGNKMCPVMDGPVSGQNFVVYQGKRYGVCCPVCEKAFWKDPASYAAKAETSVPPRA